MKLPALLSTAIAGLCLVLSVWLFASSRTTQNLQGTLQEQQQELQTAQQEVQLQQQQLQTQQEQINAGTQLAKEVGPNVLRDLGTVAVQSKNEDIKKILSKYGVTIKEDDAAAAAPAAPAAPSKPATR
jgi:type II secretory pathway pseudopilin PulG